MAKNKAISDEQLIAALLQHHTVKEAAEAVGMSTRAVYDRMTEREFKATYCDAKADLLRQAVMTCNEKLIDAITAVADIMTDAKVNPAVRLQAAQTIISNTTKLNDSLLIVEKSAGEWRKFSLAEACNLDFATGDYA